MLFLPVRVCVCECGERDVRAAAWCGASAGWQWSGDRLYDNVQKEEVDQFIESKVSIANVKFSHVSLPSEFPKQREVESEVDFFLLFRCMRKARPRRTGNERELIGDSPPAFFHVRTNAASLLSGFL